jgi:hypothetical protein
MLTAIGVWGERNGRWKLGGRSAADAPRALGIHSNKYRRSRPCHAEMRTVDQVSGKVTVQATIDRRHDAHGRQRLSVDVSQAMLQVEKDRPSTQVTAEDYPLFNYKLMLCISRACIWAADQG